MFYFWKEQKTFNEGCTYAIMLLYNLMKVRCFMYTSFASFLANTVNKLNKMHTIYYLHHAQWITIAKQCYDNRFSFSWQKYKFEFLFCLFFSKHFRRYEIFHFFFECIRLIVFFSFSQFSMYTNLKISLIIKWVNRLVSVVVSCFFFVIW